MGRRFFGWPEQIDLCQDLADLDPLYGDFHVSAQESVAVAAPNTRYPGSLAAWNSAFDSISMA